MVEIAYLPVSPDRYAIVLMNGMDDIDFLLTNKDKIEAWEKASK